MQMPSVVAAAVVVVLCAAASSAQPAAPPRPPIPPSVTVPFDTSFPLGSDDLPLDKPPLVRPPGASPTDPHGIHLTLGSGGSGAWVSWATGDGLVHGGRRPPPAAAAAAAPRVDSILQYGPAPDALTRTVEGEAQTYTQSYPGAESYTSPRLHHAFIPAADLAPGVPTFYRVGSGGSGGGGGDGRGGNNANGTWSAVRSFVPPPRPGTGAYPLRFAVLGDLGQTHNSSSTLAHATPVALGTEGGSGGSTTLPARRAAAVLYLGDMSYADDWNANSTLRTWPPPVPLKYTPSYGPKWDAWARFTEPLFAGVPAITTAGNHEVEEDADGHTFQAWRARYKGGDGSRASPASAASAPLFHSVDVGPVHVVSLNTYAPWAPGSPQRAWLEGDLAALNRSATPWVVALMHAPLYSTYASHYREVECMRLDLEPLLADAAVDVVLSGHVHAYERSHRVLDRGAQPDKGGCAPRYVVAGDGGNLERLYTVFTSGPGPALCPDPATADACGQAQAAAAARGDPGAAPFCDAAQPAWSAFRQPAYGFGVLDVLSPTRATWSWFSNLDGAVSLADWVEWSRDDACLTPGGRAAAASGVAGPVPSAVEAEDARSAKPPPVAGFGTPAELTPAELPSQTAAPTVAAATAPPAAAPKQTAQQQQPQPEGAG